MTDTRKPYFAGTGQRVVEPVTARVPSGRVTWEQHVEAWSHPPLDGIGYRSAAELLALSDADLRGLFDRVHTERYTGWRNEDNAWRHGLGLDKLAGLDVLDYGCGFGMEAAEWARRNRVWTADITAVNVALAARVAGVRGLVLESSYLIDEHYPFIATDRRFDVISCVGVLHHSRTPTRVLGRFRELLRPGGQVRLLVYGPGMWRMYVRTEPPEDVETDPDFALYVRFCDDIGSYADWYDAARLQERVNGLFDLESVGYVAGERFLVATLRCA